MSVLCLNVCSVRAKYYELRKCFKNCTSSKFARLLDTASKFALYSVSGLKGEKQTYMKTETCKLWNGICRNYKDRFWWHLAEIFRRL